MNADCRLKAKALTNLGERDVICSLIGIITDRDTGRSKGFGFVQMTDDAAAEKAIAALNGKEVNGRQLTVNEARPMEKKNFGGGGRRDRY